METRRASPHEARLRPFEHTHLGVYFVGGISILCLSYDSSKGIMETYHFNQQWYYLFGLLCLFAYLYVRPLIRRGIGSASSGYINFYAVYIFWFVSAVFYHLPTLVELGMDVKADVSLLLSVFLSTFVLIGVMNGLHYVAVSLNIISPFLFVPGTGPKQLWNAAAVNSMTVAVACSSYYSFCGNAGEGMASRPTGSFKDTMCSKWLHPAESDDFPTFKKFVLYGEASSDLASNGTILIDFPLDGDGPMPVSTRKMISPVFMLWVTLFTMYFVNSLADHVAVQTMQVQFVSQLRRRLSESSLVGNAGSTSAFRTRARSVEGWEKPVWGSGVCETSSDAGSDAQLSNENVRPNFLPMVPWYSGTSADLVKMLFDLTVSVKLFLGRFDMRTMLAATSSGWASGPRHGDGLTFNHLKDRKELWFDFCADTGDGGNSTYTVARALAQPQLKVMHQTIKGEEQSVFLPRPDVLFVGGDLAYPGPSRETYQQRLFGPFQDAFPPPSHDKPGRLVVNKPDLAKGLLKKSRTFGENGQVDPLKAYKGPLCFAIPGNHDWHDGLDTYVEQILHRGWLGGWLLPQEKSYFAVQLPHDWWLFGVDLALVNDIDMCQFRYFASVVDQMLTKDSQVVLMSHEPIWMEDWITCTVDGTGLNLRQLIRERLNGRCRIHIAGDLHFYVRHSMVARKIQKNASFSDADLTSRQSKSSSDPQQQQAEGGNSRKQETEGEGERVEFSDPLPNLNKIVSDQCLSGLYETKRRERDAKQSTPLPPIDAPHCLDPEHLIINGMGGAFLHPTHVFSGARVSAKIGGDEDDPDHSDPLISRHSYDGRPMTVGRRCHEVASARWKGTYECQAEYPSAEESSALGAENLSRFRWKNTRFDVVGALWYFLLVWSVIPCCEAASSILDASNIIAASHRFLMAILSITGLIFSKSYVSLIATIWMFCTAYAFASKGGVGGAQPPAAWTRAFHSGKPWLDGFNSEMREAAFRGYKVRTGGEGMKLLFATMHTLTHLTVAIFLILVLEIGLLTCMRHKKLGNEGYHSLYRWFESFLTEHFPDPMHLRDMLTKITFGVYPAVLKYLMAIFDVPEAVAVARGEICGDGDWEALTRIQTVGYYMGMLGYYWLLAPPAIGQVFGLYLYVCCCIFHIHYDEAFSALRIQDYKGFSRFHITPNGDLELFSLAVKQVPTSWREDPKWRGPFGAGNSALPAHLAEYPSRWVPKTGRGSGRSGEYGLDGWEDGVEFRVIDYLLVPRKRISNCCTDEKKAD
ncbi:hypothetical protein BSKO_05277 [Bryopsis sp. KO-2023]|nr:hypothetical protein BSKO_05277 [Bryopsis sp. KO-2023]